VAAAPVAKAAPGKKSPKTSLPDEGDDDDSAPAAAAPAKKPAKAVAAKKESKSKGGDWVDPFAQ
jgi:hypothetical protein